MRRERVLTTKEAAAFLRCKPDRLMSPDWRQRHGLPAVKLGRGLRFLYSDLVKFLQGQREVLSPENDHQKERRP